MSTTTRNRFVKFSLDSRCGEKVESTRDICQSKPSTGYHRTDPTMSTTINRNGYVRFSIDGRRGQKMKLTSTRAPRTCVISKLKPSTGTYRTDQTIATMINRNGFVRFSVDGRRGQKMRLTSRRVPRTCVIPTTKVSGVINHVVKTGKSRQHKYRNRTCACGDTYCNYIAKFLGTMITAKCSYANPNKGNRTSNKQFRCQKIHKQLLMFRKARNDLFTTQVPPAPPTNARFNEIHYPILFLIRAVKMCKIKRKNTRVNGCRQMWKKKQTCSNKILFARYYKHDRKNQVVVVPTLNTHQTIQARIMFR